MRSSRKNRMNIRKAIAADFPAIVALIKQFPDKLLQDHLPDPEEFTVAVDDEKSLKHCCPGNREIQGMRRLQRFAILDFQASIPYDFFVVDCDSKFFWVCK